MNNVVIIPTGGKVIWGENEDGTIQWQKMINPDGSEWYTWMAPTGFVPAIQYLTEGQVVEELKQGHIFTAGVS